MEFGLLLTNSLWNLFRAYSSKWLSATCLIMYSMISNIEIKMMLSIVDILSFFRFVEIFTSGLRADFSSQNIE